MELEQAADIYFRSRPRRSRYFAPFEGQPFEQPRGTYWIRQSVDAKEARVQANGVMIAARKTGTTKWFPDPKYEESEDDDISE